MLVFVGFVILTYFGQTDLTIRAITGMAPGPGDPIITIQSPESKIYTSVLDQPLSLNVSMSETGTMKYELDSNGVNITACTSCSSFSLELPILSDEQHSIIVWGIDETDQTGSATVNFEIAITPNLATISTDHPHLFFTDADLTRIRNNYNNNYQSYGEALRFFRVNYFSDSCATNFDSNSYAEDNKAKCVFKLGFRCIMTQSSSDCENAYNGLMNVGKSDRLDASSAMGGILQRARTLNNYVRAYDYTYNYIQANHPNDIGNIEDLLMGKALAFVAMLNEGGTWAYLQSSERHEVQMVVGLVALTLPHYQRSSLTFCGKDTTASCSETYTYPAQSPPTVDGAPHWDDVNSQDMLEYVMQGAFGTELSSNVRSISPEYFDAHFFNQKSRDGVEAGNAKEYHGQYLIYPFLFAWDHLFGPSNSLLYDLRAMADANVELKAPDGSIFEYQETPSDHFGHSYAGAYIANKYGGNVEKYFVYPKKCANSGTCNRAEYDQYNLGDIYFSIWNDNLESVYENAVISDMYKLTDSESVIFPDGGIVALRNGYEADSTMVLLYANHKLNDKYGFGAHQGSWGMYANGRYMAKNLDPAGSTTISGLPDADPLENDRLGGGCSPSTFAKSAAGANAILVDDYGARNVYRSNEMHDPAYFTDNIFTSDLDYVGMTVTYDEAHFTTSASCGHISPVEPNGITVDRHFIFPKDYLIIIDETSGATSSHEYSFNMWVASSQLKSYYITSVDISTYSGGLIKAKIEGVNPTFITVHSPNSLVVSDINIQGGKGGKINGDYIAYKTGSDIIISDSSIETDAEIMFVSTDYFFVKDATYMEIDGTIYGVGLGTGVFLRDCFDTCNSLGYECGYVCGELCGECGIGENCIGGKCECAPKAETCNNQDDDCDGQIDEDLIRDCNLNYVGKCAEGNETCAGGLWDGCPKPRAENCNNQDDDCDGIVDSFTRQCGTTNVGPCEYGSQICLAGSWDACVGNIEPEPEICDDSIDQDCDGSDLPCPPCLIQSAKWSRENATEEERVNIIVKGKDCNNVDVNLTYEEEDNLLDILGPLNDPIDADLLNLPRTITITGDTGSYTWTTQWIEDSDSLDKDPEYIFTAQAGDTKTSEILKVFQQTCTENWNCSDWGPCVKGEQKRTCTDLNDCGTMIDLYEENLTQSCIVSKNLNISLTQDWNLINIPVEIENPTIEYVFREIVDKIYTIYTFNPTNRWLVYHFDKSIPSHDFNITAGRAYKIKAKENTTLVVNGTISTLPRTLEAGWNLIGLKNTDEVSFKDFFELYANNIETAWKLENGTYEQISVSSTDKMKPVKGYWLLINKTIEISG